MITITYSRFRNKAMQNNEIFWDKIRAIGPADLLKFIWNNFLGNQGLPDTFYHKA